MLKLELWEGDRLFLRYMDERAPFFSLKLAYVKGNLMSAVLDGKKLEFFDLLDENGKKTGRIKERSLVHEDGDAHATVHIWVVRKTENGYDVLLQKRSANKDSFPGCYDISSAGHVAAGDEYLKTAVREMQEELGIAAKEKDLEYVGIHRGKITGRFYGREFKNYEISAVYVYDKPAEISELTLQEEEVEEVIWMDYALCLEKMKNGEIKHCIFQDEYEMLGRYLGVSSF